MAGSALFFLALCRTLSRGDKIKMELCAPAGGEKAFKAAIAAGADAVYLGLGGFNMRAKADNFDMDGFGRAVRYAHLFGVRVFLALNSCIKPREYSEVLSLIERVSVLKPDAYIITDISLIKRIREMAPESKIHISTQTGVQNLLGARFFELLGADRVVLSREASIETLSLIKEKTSLEVEVFVHGALCVSFSGACLMSSLIFCQSGNRGACLQPCRLPYILNGEKGFFLSPKDLCLIERLELLRLADAVKIEGRLKRPEYAAETVRRYRKVLDGAKPTPEDLNALKKIYNRGGFCDGYLNGGDGIISKNLQSHIGLEAGTVKNVEHDSEYSKITLFSEYSYRAGDGFKLLRNGAEVFGGEIVLAGAGKDRTQILTVRKFSDIKTGDAMFVTTDTAQIAELNALTKKLPIDIALKMRIGEPAELRLSGGGAEVLILGEAVGQADKAPLRALDIEKSLTRINEREDVFKISKISIDVTEDIFYPLSLLNKLRRSAVSTLKERIIEAYERTRR